MRDRQLIEREIYRAREDLETNLAELKHVVQETIDVKARARVAVAKGKQKAQEALEVGKVRAQQALEAGKVKAHDALIRGKEVSRDLADRSKLAAKERPVLVGAIVGGIVAAGALVYIGRKKHWW